LTFKGKKEKKKMEAVAKEGTTAAMAAATKGALARVLRVGPGPAEWVVACKAGGLFVHRNQWAWSLPPAERVYAAQILQDHVDQLLATSHWGTTPGTPPPLAFHFSSRI
jgi:hypothetical protein